MGIESEILIKPIHGNSSVINEMMKCVTYKVKIRLLGLLDKDTVGLKMKEEWEKYYSRAKKGQCKYKLLLLDTPPHLRDFPIHSDYLSIQPEKCLPIDYWRYAMEQGWLEEDLSTFSITNGNSRAETYKGIPHDGKIIVFYKLIRGGMKKSFFEYACKRIRNEGIPDTLSPNIERMIKFLLPDYGDSNSQSPLSRPIAKP